MKKIIYLVSFILFATGLRAQSYHFSQFFSTPLLTNPAHTGFTEGPYRVASNFRSQGLSGGNPYFTGYISGDVSPFRSSLMEGHKVGLGMFVMNDKSSNGALQTSSIGVSGAYHVGLSEVGEQSIGVGLQGTYHQRRVNYSKLSFGNQFGPDGYDAALPVGEALDNYDKNYFDVNAGILYNALLEDKSFFAGISVYNILNKAIDSLSNEFQMPSRVMFQSGAQLFVGEQGKLYISLTHMAQAGAKETSFGGAYGIQLGDRDFKNEVNVGMWYRLNDAVIPYVGYYYNGFHVGLSYDHTVSALKTGAQLKNGFELTLLFSAIDKTKLKTLIPWY